MQDDCYKNNENTPKPSEVEANPKRKTEPTIVSNELEEKILKWIKFCEDFKIPVVSYATIRMQGWLHKFTYANNLLKRRVCGEGASVEHDEVEDGRKMLKDEL
ncbi:hypothetical protein THRCLA_23156, partial [Thraustotheca clavata]